MKPKTVLITGASSGIGKASAIAFQQTGFTVYASARRPESLRDLEGIGCHALRLDVTDEASMIAGVRTIETQHGGVDILVNNAGYGLNGPLEELELAAVRDQFETNLFGLLRLSQLVTPSMRRAQWGRIIHIGSVGGSFTAPGAGAYHASKYALEAISDAMRMELRGFGIDVVLVKPTGVYTEFDKKITDLIPDTGLNSPYAYFKTNHIRVTKNMFQGRNTAGIIRPEQVARMVLTAVKASRPRARYIVGTSGHVYIALRRLVSDRIWDAIMTAQFPMRPRGA
jgi:NAD(P)-dependent dehydrogenase (short-subunit alcohol dehydrogenase family)